MSPSSAHVCAIGQMSEGRRGWKIPAVELSLVLLLSIVDEVECTTGRGRNKTYKNSPCSATSRDGLEIEIRFFLEANFVGDLGLILRKGRALWVYAGELYSTIVAVETFDFHPFARFEHQHIRYEIVEQSRNKQGGKITIDNVPAEYLLENE